ncbi:DNA alkylation repair protein [Candidatus Margulisiibacteriota bacterium]
MTIINNLNSELEKLKDPEKVKIYQRFFKTGKGEYGEGDIFWGIKVPVSRKLAKKYKDLSLDELQELISSEIHEKRLIALFILIIKYKKADQNSQKQYYAFYLKNIKHINNWDLIDSSAEHIVGNYLADKPKDILYKLARSIDLWERRIAVMSTFGYIKKQEFKDTLQISEILLSDSHDLIHKAVGWMLREIGNRDLIKEEEFLKKHYKKMPRTMLRYAIEKFEETKRQGYLKGNI